MRCSSFLFLSSINNAILSSLLLELLNLNTSIDSFSFFFFSFFDDLDLALINASVMTGKFSLVSSIESFSTLYLSSSMGSKFSTMGSVMSLLRAQTLALREKECRRPTVEGRLWKKKSIRMSPSSRSGRIILTSSSAIRPIDLPSLTIRMFIFLSHFLPTLLFFVLSSCRYDSM